jgi:hypothetical protein
MVLRLALFPGAWLVIVIGLACQGWAAIGINLRGGAVGFVTALLAGASYLIGRPRPEARRTSTAQIVVVWPLIACCMWPITLEVTGIVPKPYDDPIGTVNDNGKGDDLCEVQGGDATSNGDGLVATVRESTCPIGRQQPIEYSPAFH